MVTLKGITWDHPRGFQPLLVISENWKTKSNVELRWDIRTLKDFGDYPIELLIGIYDLIILDHPYVGSAAANKLLLPLEEYLPDSFLNIQQKQSVGAGFDSYWYNGHCWALPIDAAAQVAAYRKDLINSIGWELPDKTVKLNDAAQELPKKYSIGIPLCPTDMWCVFLTLCAQYTHGNVFVEDDHIDLEAGEWALEQILSWKPFIYRASFHMNPIEMLEYMSKEDDILYIPFIFGYTNYARKGWRKKLIHFCNVPKYELTGKSSLLGGAGLAISANTNCLKECLDFMQLVLSVDIQKHDYFRNGGQPAHLSAWLDEQNNKDCSCFFLDTLKTINDAFVRPRHPGFNQFQEKAADYIYENVINNSPAGKVIQKLNVIYQLSRNERV